MKKPTINTLVGGYASNTQLNAIFEDILEAFDNTVSRDGSTPNSMDADLDLNGSDLINAENIYTDNLYVDGVRLVDATAVPVWKGAWSSGASYLKDDIVREDGSSYICLVAHTSGSFATDLTASKWALFASKGTAGAGTGDLLAANNLSDLASAATARSNLGLGSVAVESTLPVAKGGTGATTASAARTALGLGTAAIVDVIDEDNFATDSATQPPSQQSVKALFTRKYCVASDQKSSGTAAGSVPSTNWETRTLNTLGDNTASASLSANAVTLGAGTWHVKAWAGAYNCFAHRLRLYNVTSGAAVEGPLGLNAYARSTADAHTTIAVLDGYFTLASSSAIALQHRTVASGASVLYGAPCSFGTNEVYAMVEFEKVSP